MRVAWRILVWVALVMTAPSAHAEKAVLAMLEYKAGMLGEAVPIYDRPGGSPSPYSKKPRQVWTLLEGDTLKQTKPPPERLIRFYENANNNTLSVCTIIVKYSRTAKGWRPGYQLLTHPLVIVENGKLTPVGTDEGARGMVQIVKPSAPNREGFYHTLSFGLITGKITIDAWEVQ